MFFLIFVLLTPTQTGQKYGNEIGGARIYSCIDSILLWAIIVGGCTVVNSWHWRPDGIQFCSVLKQRIHYF